MFKSLFSFTGLALATLLFVALNALSSSAFRGARVDLTEHGLYTLSQGSRNILGNLDEPVTLRLFYSRTLALKELGSTPVPAYAQRVQELLEEYEAASGDLLQLEIVDPQPYSEEEDAAVGFGLRGARVSRAGDQFFLGLAGTNSVDDLETIPFFDPAKEASLEYELTQLVYRLAVSDKPVIGLLSSLPMEGVPSQDPRNPAPSETWVIMDWLRQSLEVQSLAADVEEIPSEVDVLMLVHPKALSTATEYAIDQFAMRGGRILAFVDPYSLFDPTQGNPQMGGMGADKTSHLDSLLTAWGVSVDAAKIVGDNQRGRNVQGPGGMGVSLPLFLTVTPEELSSEDFTTAELSNVSFFAPGHISQVEGASTSLEVLAHTTEEGAGELDTFHLQYQQDFARLAELFEADGKQRNLIVRLTGPIKSAFPEGRPAPVPAPTAEGEEPAPPTELAPHIAEYDGFEAIIVADADILHNQLWTQAQNFFGQVVHSAVAGNGSLVANALENLSGSTDLISLRSREGFQRPFTHKDDLREAAEEQYQAKQQELEARLRETEEQINQLRQPADDSGGMLINDEQQKALETFQEEYGAIGKELRDVRHQLNADIDALGTRLKWLNIAAVPLGLILLGLLTFLIKAMTRRTA
ncbi:MAG: ABC-type uncharacterized transport system involved in gliding motility auxiliary subunit [Planctomycetota bacterium]|jgi:ABC-type uncharacterized transport system involved in gliding motility auxiliary subunit